MVANFIKERNTRLALADPYIRALSQSMSALIWALKKGPIEKPCPL
jgi:hypothetical protein